MTSASLFESTTPDHTPMIDHANPPSPRSVGIDRFDTIGLEALNGLARLQTRKDRKYILTQDQLRATLFKLDAGDSRVLETDDRRWFSYETVYFDTPSLDSYRLAATKRPARFKVRTRSYLDAEHCVLEVKTKSRRGKTIKHRQEHQLTKNTSLDDQARHYLGSFDEVSPFVDQLDAALTTRYERATLVFAKTGTRATIDADFRCCDTAGRCTGLGHELILETKSSGRPTPLDYALWSVGLRPIKISKFATGLAALNPELAANRWSRVLRTHFGRQPGQHTNRGQTVRSQPADAPFASHDQER